MRKTLSIGVFAAATLLLTACGTFAGTEQAPAQSAGETQSGYHRISVQEAKARMDSGDAIVILDVRTPGEFAEKHIPGAISLPNETIGGKPPAELPDPQAEILVYCRSGNRSAQAVKKLAAMGYTKLYDFGGIRDWPYKTVSGGGGAQ